MLCSIVLTREHKIGKFQKYLAMERVNLYQSPHPPMCVYAYMLQIVFIVFSCLKNRLLNKIYLFFHLKIFLFLCVLVCGHTWFGTVWSSKGKYVGISILLLQCRSLGIKIKSSDTATDTFIC